LPADNGCWDVFGATRFGLVRRFAASLGVSVLRVYMGWMLRRRWALGNYLGSEAVCGFVGGFCCGARRLVGSNV